MADKWIHTARLLAVHKALNAEFIRLRDGFENTDKIWARLKCVERELSARKIVW